MCLTSFGPGLCQGSSPTHCKMWKVTLTMSTSLSDPILCTWKSHITLTGSPANFTAHPHRRSSSSSLVQLRGWGGERVKGDVMRMKLVQCNSCFPYRRCLDELCCHSCLWYCPTSQLLWFHCCNNNVNYWALLSQAWVTGVKVHTSSFPSVSIEQ